MLNHLAAVSSVEPINLAPPSTSFNTIINLQPAGIIGAALQLVLIIAAIVFFFILIIGGIRWIVSGGDKAQTENARNQITAALVGLVIVFAAWAIARLIGVFFGIDIFNLNPPSVTEFQGVTVTPPKGK